MTDSNLTKNIYLIDEKLEEEYYLKSLNHKPFYSYGLEVFGEDIQEIFLPETYKKLHDILKDKYTITTYDQNLESLLSLVRDQQNILILNAAYPFISNELYADFNLTCHDQSNLEWSTVVEIDGQVLDVAALSYAPKFENQSTDENGLFEIEFAESMTPINRLPWETYESIARSQLMFSEPGFPKVKLLVLDADGVLNDAGFYYGPDGEVMKKFNTRDGAGIKQIQALGVEVGIITGEKTGFTPARAEKIGIKRIELGCSKKLPVLEKWKAELNLDWDQVAYMGDDLPDVPCLETVGMPGCPANAEPEVRAVSKFVASLDGGQGCVREFIRYMIYEKIITDSDA